MKQNRRISLKRVFINMVLAVLTAFAIAPLTGAAAVPFVALGIFAFGTIPQILGAAVFPHGAMLEGVATEIWVKDIEENIYPDSSFIQEGRPDDDYIDNTKVKLPQAGGAPTVKRNRDEYPIPVAKRGDTIIEYPVVEFSTDATHIQYSEELEVSYNKRQSILFDHQEILKEDIADYIMHAWAPTKTNNVLKTTGASRAPINADQDSVALTGNRKKASKDDFARIVTALDNMNVPQEGRVILVDTRIKMDITTLSELGMLDTIGTEVLRDGTVTRIMGMKIHQRSKMVRYSNDSNPQLKAEKSAALATDRLAMFAWHPMFVRRALGTGAGGNIKVFIDLDSAVYQGSVISALSRCGATKARFDERGIIALVEDFA